MNTCMSHLILCHPWSLSPSHPPPTLDFLVDNPCCKWETHYPSDFPVWRVMCHTRTFFGREHGELIEKSMRRLWSIKNRSHYLSVKVLPIWNNSQKFFLKFLFFIFRWEKYSVTFQECECLLIPISLLVFQGLIQSVIPLNISHITVPFAQQ